jgi:hypothetical protein
MKARTAAGAISSETFVASDRHKLEANYFDCARSLKRVAAGFKRSGNMPYPAAPAVVRPTSELQHAAE